MSKNNKIICNVCGEENPGNAKFCISCGAKLGDSPAKEQATVKETQSKRMEPSKILLFVLGSALIGVLILFVAGTFDKVPTIKADQSGANSQQTTENRNGNPAADPNNPHAGADMEKLKEITELEKVVKENPSDHQSLVKLAHLLNDTGFYSKAINKYQEYLKVHPDDADVRVDMGVCYFQIKDFDNAISTMKEALKYQPKHQIAHFNIGIVYFNAGDLNKAKEWWKKAIALDPNSDIAKKAKELIDNN
ncbi:MAG: tetratricopeptide repeat protein [Chlorobi bacterium]|nr:tetratricopeptide repeat protein [Chlorobiota bacterium]